MRASLRSEAAAEIARARSWYEDHKPGLGVAFEETLTATLGLIRENPKAFPIVHRDVRRALLHRFPYAVYYQLAAIRFVSSLVYTSEGIGEAGKLVVTPDPLVSTVKAQLAWRRAPRPRAHGS